MSKMIIVVLLLGILVDSSIVHSMTTPDRTVRIALHKATSMKAQRLGQPITSYFVTTTVGTPPKPFNMLIDINAQEVWLPQYEALGRFSWKLNFKDGYKKQDSTTGIKELSEIYTIKYKGYELSGNAYRDVLCLEDIIEGNSVKFEQRFLAIAKASNSDFSKYPSVHGVLAFNPWPISETGSDLVAVTMNRAHLTSKLIFGLALDANSENHDGGELTIGGTNPDKHHADIKYHQIVEQNSWQVSIQRVMLGVNSVDACLGTNGTNPASCTAVLSTTSNDIYGPTSAIEHLLKLLGMTNVDKGFNPSSLYEIDCLKTANAPTLTFVIDNVDYVVPPTTYIRKKVDGYIFKTPTCYVSLLPNLSENQWELGTNFLSSFYTIFDMRMRAVALARRK